MPSGVKIEEITLGRGARRAIPLNQALTSLLKSSTRYLNRPWRFVNPA